MKQLSEGVYEVPSDSSFGKHYVVNLTHPGRPECTCTNWAIQRNKRKAAGQNPDPYECKHVRMALRADPNLLKKQRAAEADAAKATQAAFEAEQQAKADKMKAELIKMRADLHGESPALKKPKPAEMGVEDVLIAAQLGEPLPDPGAIDDLIAEAQNVPVVTKKPRRTAARVEAEEKAAAGDLMAQLEAAIIAQKNPTTPTTNTPTTVTVVCPTEPDPDNGCEGCGETFTAVPDEGYVECPFCGLAFDVTRAQTLETA